MEIILSVGEVFLYILAGIIVLVLLLGFLYLLLEAPIIGFPVMFIALGFSAITSTVSGNKEEINNFTQKANLDYSYKFTDLKESPDNYPGAKCLVKINNKKTDESVDAETNETTNSSSNYNNKYYIDKSCAEFKNEIEATVQSVNDKIESSRINEVPLKENSESSEDKTKLEKSVKDTLKDEDEDILGTVLKSHFDNFKAYNTEEKRNSFEFKDAEQLSMITQKNVAHYIQLRNQISDSKIIMDSVFNPNGPIDKMSSEQEYKKFQSEILPIVNYFTENHFTKDIIIINIDEIEPNNLYKVNFKTIIKNQDKKVVEETKNFANLEIRYEIDEETRTPNPETFQVIHYEIYEMK